MLKLFTLAWPSRTQISTKPIARPRVRPAHAQSEEHSAPAQEGPRMLATPCGLLLQDREGRFR